MEGYTDVLALDQTGIGSAACCGTALTLQQVGLLGRYVKEIQLLYDKELDKDDLEDVRMWAKSSLEWLRNECRGKLAKALLHMDESRPHIHAFIRPVNEPGHLSYKKYFSGSDNLRKLHQSHEASLNWMRVVSNMIKVAV